MSITDLANSLAGGSDVNPFIIYVSALTGSDVTGDGTLTNPYQTIDLNVCIPKPYQTISSLQMKT